MKDTIYREDAIKAINCWFECNSLPQVGEGILYGIPSADRPQGKWKRRIVDYGFNADWKCSECGYKVFTDFVGFNYCPNCGCRMKGAVDE